MRQGIVVLTGEGREKILYNFSIQNVFSHKQLIYTLFEYDKGDFELGAIRHMFYNTDIDEFLLLHDTCEIKDNKLFDIVFDQYEGKSVALANHPCIFGMYLGKYRREVLNMMYIPKAHNKIEAVEYEMTFNTEYCKLDGDVKLLDNPLHDTDVFIEKFGRKNMVLENDLLIKYKATWNRSMVK